MIPYILAAVGGYLIGDSLKGKQFARGGQMTTWGGVRGALNKPVLSFSKIDYDVNVNPENLEVDVNIKERDLVDYDALSETGAEWEQYAWGYMIYPQSVDELYQVLKALQVSVSKERLQKYINENENYSDGGRISKGVKWKQEWTDTKGVEGYDVLEIEDTKYFSNNYRGGIVVRSRIIESSKPERVGNYQEDSKTELRKIFSGKYPFAYKYSEGGKTELRKVPKKVAGELTLSPNRTAKLTANKLMLIDNNIWEELDINSGSELYNDDELQKKYVEKLEKANVDKIISSENLIRSKVMDLLEENNYSSLHQYFIYKGVFGEAKRNDYIDMYNSGGSYGNLFRMLLNPALFTSDLHGKPFTNPKMAKGGVAKGQKSNLKDDIIITELKKMAKGGQVYKLGDKWSPNFDYTGMLETALKAQVSWGMDKLRKLYDSFEDVNYHTASRSLWEALKSLKDNDVKAAEKHLENFRADVMEEMN